MALNTADVSRPSTQGISQKKKLGLLMCTALVVGNMIGSGVFLLPASLAPFGGISILGWLASAGGAICLALVFAKLGQVLPRTGGPYAFSHAAFGEFGGFLVAWSYWISMWATNAALAVAFVSYMTVFMPVLRDVPIAGGAAALIALWVLTVVNIAGVRTAGVVQLVTTALKLLPLLAISLAGLFFFDGSHFQPFNASGGSALSAVSATITLTLWAFLGLESGTVPAGEVEDPERTIPRATIIGTLIATVVYIMGTVAVMGLIEPGALRESTAPFADAARLIVGDWGAYAVAAGAAISCFGALNGWILLSGQLPMAAAQDGMLPRALARVGPTGTPVTGIVVSSIIASAIIALNYTRGLVNAFNFLILLATLATLIPYVFSSMAVLLLQDRRDARAVTSAGVWTVATLAFLYAMWAIIGSGRDAVFWGFVLFIAGIPLYVMLVRPRRVQT
jgi:APA family basic amino acid/polyamine antiporter